MSPLFVIARKDPKDDEIARAAERAGVTLLRLSLLQTEPGSDGDRFLQWLGKPPAGAAIAWTSKRAAEILSTIALPGARETLTKLPLFALGSDSAAPIRDAGLAVEVPREGEGAAVLAEWILRHRAERGIVRVAFLHGDKALPALPDSLREAGVEVESFEIYRTSYLSPPVTALTDALQAGSAVEIAFFSPSAVDALERLLSPEGVAALRRDGVAHSRGETTHNALTARGYRRAKAPSLECETMSSAWLGGVNSWKRKS